MRKLSTRKRRRGTETIEFALAFIPYFAILGVLCDASWSIFVKATLQYAVRAAVRKGITITGTQATAASESLTDMVKDTVQGSALGFLNGTSGRAYIQVHYLAEDSSSPTGVSDVSTQTNGNAPGNLMQVSISSYPVGALLPRIYSLFTPVDKNPAMVSVFSADRIEPSGDVPAIGTAP
jgi:Flp pilus assembly protein TadG